MWSVVQHQVQSVDWDSGVWNTQWWTLKQGGGVQSIGTSPELQTTLGKRRSDSDSAESLFCMSVASLPNVAFNIWSPGDRTLFTGGGETQTNWVTLFWVTSWFEGKVNQSGGVKGGSMYGMHKQTPADWGCRTAGVLPGSQYKALRINRHSFHPSHSSLGVV